MAKVELSKALEAIHGVIGDLLFRNHAGHQTVGRLPNYSERPLPDKLEAQKPVMQRASHYWNSLKTENPELARAYAQRAKELDRPVFSLAYADVSSRPTVQEIDVTRYSGRTGQKITVRATGAFELRQVQVLIREAGGAVVESGSAVKGGGRNTWWDYTTTTDVPALAGVSVEAVAVSWPDNKDSRVQLISEV
jgi:hypothetical protein